MQIVHGLTLSDLVHKAEDINRQIGAGRKERHYQKCLDVELRRMGIPTAVEDPVPVYYQGEMVWQGRADLIIGRCCVELKAIAKPPSAAGRQLQDYISEKNKIVLLQHGLSSAFFAGAPSNVNDDVHLRSIQHLLYWGLVINFNPSTGGVETFIPPQTTPSKTPTLPPPPPTRIYADTELLGCRVKMQGIRGMVDSITAGDRGEILFQVGTTSINCCKIHHKSDLLLHLKSDV
jgi:GxxExxY protein